MSDSDRLKEAIERGAEISSIAQLVEVSGLGDLVKRLEQTSIDQQKSYAKQMEIFVGALDRLIVAVGEMSTTVENNIDLTEFNQAIQSLKQDALVIPDPVEWNITFERDQRHLMKSGIKLTPTPRVLN